MKMFLLVVIVAMNVNFLQAQIEESFISAPSGWVLAQGAQFVNGIILTPGVGGYNPANIGTPAVSKTSNKVKVCFDIWATDAYGNGTKIEPFPCTTYADILFVKSTVTNSKDAELVENIYARQDNYLLPENGGTTGFTFSFPALVTVSDFKVFISFHADCIQGGIKYIMDNLSISGVALICGGTNCAPVALNDLFNRNNKDELSFNGVLFGSNDSFPSVPLSYAVDITGTDNDVNDKYDHLQWSSLTQPVNGSVIVHADGSFFISRNSPAVTQLIFTYRLTDDGPDNDINTGADNMYNDAMVTVNWPLITLPVSLINFYATRSGPDVNLQWTTTFESNNAGFQIQRSKGDGVWENGEYVPTKALGGTSSTSITYEFKETNMTTGFAWYRLVQIDKNNTRTISVTRGVRGTEVSARVSIYPNPNTAGNMNVLFGSSATRDVSITDLSGKIVKIWKSIRSDNLIINGINPGVYMLQIMTEMTNERQTHKIVIVK
jgi:hypothetical protein